MNFYIKGITEAYDAPALIINLGNFIIKNKGYLFVFREVLASAKIPNDAEREKIIDLLLQEAVLSKIITYDIDAINKFKKMIKDFFESDNNDSGNTRGKVFEYIVYNVGPVHLVGNVEKKRKCFIEDQDGKKVGGQNNFDVGFHNDYECLAELEVELLECKINLRNALFSKELKLNEKAIKKLNYMSEVANCLSSCKQGVIGFITMIPSVRKYIPILEEQGFKNVKIFSFDDIKRVLNNKAS